MERKDEGPEPQAPDHSDPPVQTGGQAVGGIDLSQVDDEVSVIVRKRDQPKPNAQKPGSRLAAFLRATKPNQIKSPAQPIKHHAVKVSSAEQGPVPSEPKQWPPSRPQAQAPEVHQKKTPSPATKSAPPAVAIDPPAAAASVSKTELPAAKLWPPSREPSPEQSPENHSEPELTSTSQAGRLEPKSKNTEPPAERSEPQTPLASKAPEAALAKSPATSKAAKPETPSLQTPEPPTRPVSADSPAHAPRPSSGPTDAQQPAIRTKSELDPNSETKNPEKSPLADYLPPGLRKPVEENKSEAASWPPPRDAPQTSQARTDPPDIPEVAAGPLKSANRPKAPLPTPHASPRTSLREAATSIKEKLSTPFAGVFKRRSSKSLERAAQSEIEAEPSPMPEPSKAGPESSPPDQPSQTRIEQARPASSKETQGPSRAPAPSLRTYPFSPVQASQQASSSPRVDPPRSVTPATSTEYPRPSLSVPAPAQVPAAFVRTKPRTPVAPPTPFTPAPFVKTETPIDEPQDSGLGTFKRRQTPPQPRLRKQHSYRHINSTPESTLGLRWWYHHWSAVTWLGRSLWVGAFICAWVALSRCLDPAISDPQLSQVPYVALLGWLLCAGLTFNQRIPSRFRWTGLMLGAANSIALALSWSFRLDQL